MTATASSVDEGAPVMGSGNYLADRGYADPDEARFKFLMSNEFALIVEQRGWTEANAAEVTGLAQPDVSRIVNGNVKDYSVWRLMKALASLGKNVRVEFSQSDSDVGQILTNFVEPEIKSGPATAI